ncbi:hypothetical protein C8J57DRAFT_1521281 [Mycena rebaudengoi]|nr:hypothetical protein C8J57DRAFT_1521281 [Mycena rebaudengoi]
MSFFSLFYFLPSYSDSQESQNHGQESAAFFLPPPPRPRVAPIASFGQPDASLGGSALDSPMSAFASMSTPPATPSPPTRRRRSTYTPAGTPLHSHGSGGSGVRRAVTTGAVPGFVRSLAHPLAHTRRGFPLAHSDGLALPLARQHPLVLGACSAVIRAHPVLLLVLALRCGALQESITSLLGKRWSAVLDDEQELQQPRARRRSSPRCPQSHRPSIALSDPAPVRAVGGGHTSR